MATESERSSFPRSERLLRRGEFLRVQQGGRRVHTAHFVILVVPRSEPGRRIGVTVGKRIGNAVRRNRVKRLVRAVYRCNKAFFPADCDVVLVARPGAEALDYATVRAEVERARDALARLADIPAKQPAALRGTTR
jgi:ribonuclease P protein component